MKQIRRFSSTRNPEPGTRNRPPETGGFTLLEVLVALFLVATALALTIQLLAADLRGVGASGDSMRAVLLAEERMQELLASTEVPAGNWTDLEKNGWRVDVQVTDELAERTEGLGIRLKKISLTVRRAADRQAGVRERSFTLTTLHAQTGMQAP